MRELHEGQIKGLRKIFNSDTLKKPLDIRMNCIHYPGTKIEQIGDKYRILLTEKGKDNTEIKDDELKSPEDRLKHYIITINAIRQLQTDGYLHLVRINDIEASDDLNRENEVRKYEFQDTDFNNFLNKYFYATIFPTYELLDYILKGETIETERHSEQMQVAKKDLGLSKTTNFISILAFIVSTIGLSISVCTTPTIDKKQIQEIIDRVDEIGNVEIPGVIDTRIINDTLKVDAVTKRQKTS